MCTASWLRQAGSLHLFFNRDELRSREPAGPPIASSSAGARWIAPIDGRAGGTWIAATHYGLALALLNRSDGALPEVRESRGALIPRLAAATSRERLVGLLADSALDRLAPFRLLALWRNLEHGIVASWDGVCLDIGETAAALGLLCSSGLGDQQATATRTPVFEAHRARTTLWSAEAHRIFHRDHAPERSAWSPCMHREDAESVSFTEIELVEAEAVLRYHPAPPCQPAAWNEQRIAQLPIPEDE